MYESMLPEFFDFLQQTPTCFHVVDFIRRQLQQSGYVELSEHLPFTVQAGGKYFVVRNESSLIAFQLPQGNFSGFQIVASHSDFPAFKLKAQPELEAASHYIKLNVERYGGMLYAPWFDRPLSIAGRVIVRTGACFTTRLFDAQRDLVLIPNLAIHFDSNANAGKTYNPQVDLLPVLGDNSSKGALSKLIADTLQVEENAIYGSDLFLYPRITPTLWGIHNEYIAAPHLDDLQCSYASFRAFLDAHNEQSVPVLAIFDNEEVGSGTKQGASGTFLQDTLCRIHWAVGHSPEAMPIALASSMMVSADNAHAVHPNHAEKSDAVHRPYLNGGIVIKYNANQKYTTDAVSAALFKAVCEKAGVPWQEFHNRSDLTGGSTLGNLSNMQVSLNTVDIGLPQLAMHSVCECAGVKDSAYLATALQIFYSSHIESHTAGCFSLAMP